MVVGDESPVSEAWSLNHAQTVQWVCQELQNSWKREEGRRAGEGWGYTRGRVEAEVYLGRNGVILPRFERILLILE